jgi:outer membrane protein
MLPFVNGNVSHGINQGRSIDPFTNSYIDQRVSIGSYNLNASLNLWNGLSQREATRQSKLAYESDVLDERQAEQNIAISTTLAYLQVLNAEQQLGQAVRQTAVTMQQVRRLQALDSIGSIAPALLYDLQGQLSGDRINELNIESSLESARLTLAQLMNVPYSGTMKFSPLSNETILATGDVQQPTAAALLAQPGVRAAGLRMQSTAKGLQAAKGARQPTLYLAGIIGTNYSSAASRASLLNVTEVPTADYVFVGAEKVPVYTSQRVYNNTAIPYGDQWRNNVFSSLSLGVRVPLVSGGQLRQRIELAEVAASKAAYEAQTISSQLQRSIEQATINLDFARKRYLQFAKQANDFEQSFRAAEVRFNAGLGTVVDYLAAKNNLDRARSGLIASRFECLLLGKVLEYYVEPGT